jgi:hypothetical protein
VVHRYVRIFQQRRLPGRRPRLANCLVWRRGSVRHRHGLHRLRQALQVPAVSTTTFPAAAVTAAAVTAAPPHGMHQHVFLTIAGLTRLQRRLPGRRARLALSLVWHASAVRNWN